MKYGEFINTNLSYKKSSLLKINYHHHINNHLEFCFLFGLSLVNKYPVFVYVSVVSFTVSVYFSNPYISFISLYLLGSFSFISWFSFLVSSSTFSLSNFSRLRIFSLALASSCVKAFSIPFSIFFICDFYRSFISLTISPFFSFFISSSILFICYLMVSFPCITFSQWAHSILRSSLFSSF